MDPKTIKPKVNGKSDFFSWNLYRWTKANPSYCRVYRGIWNSCAGKNNLGKEWLCIGYRSDDMWFHGRPIIGVCRDGKPKEKYAYSPGEKGHDAAHWEDITEEFWKRYMEIGVCAIHGERAHKWVESGRERTCEYCGKKERKLVFIESVERWV